MIHRITITPAVDTGNKNRVGSRGPLYRVMLNGEVLVTSYTVDACLVVVAVQHG
jgi:hypothetical protein